MSTSNTNTIPNILIVDDEEDIRMIIALELKKHGHDTIECDGGNNAYKMIEQHPEIQVVISDINMTNGTGIELLEKLRKKNLDYPYFILFTGYSDLTAEEAYSLGANALIYKPVEFSILAEIVKHFCLPQDARFNRKFFRGNIKLDVDAKFDPDKSSIQTQSFNIGRGGMFLIIEKDLPKVGDHLSFKITPKAESSQQLEGIAVVRWIREKSLPNLPRGIGVEFINLSESSIKILLQLLAEMTLKSYIPRY